MTRSPGRLCRQYLCGVHCAAGFEVAGLCLLWTGVPQGWTWCMICLLGSLTQLSALGVLFLPLYGLEAVVAYFDSWYACPRLPSTLLLPHLRDRLGKEREGYSESAARSLQRLHVFGVATGYPVSLTHSLDTPPQQSTLALGSYLVSGSGSRSPTGQVTGRLPGDRAHF